MIASDVDGTLLRHRHRVDWDDPKSVATGWRPNRAVVAWLREQRRQGQQVYVVSARPDWMRGITRHAVDSLLGPGVPLYLQDRWIGWGASHRHKRTALESIGSGLYCGDQAFDRRAAIEAGWTFISAQAIEEWPRIQARPIP